MQGSGNQITVFIVSVVKLEEAYRVEIGDGWAGVEKQSLAIPRHQG